MKYLCINIDSDTESWRLSQEQFARVGLVVERLSAVVLDNRPLAFNRSVYKAIQQCVSEKEVLNPHTGEYVTKPVYEDLMLFEDDVVFDTDRFKFNLPYDFMTLHMGCNIIGTDNTVWKMPTKHNDNLAVLHNCWQSHATIYSAECVKFILDNFNPNVLDENNMIFDEWLRTNVLVQGRSYVMNPMVAYQRPRHSDIWNVPSDYTGCHKQGNEWLKNNL